MPWWQKYKLPLCLVLISVCLVSKQENVITHPPKSTKVWNVFMFGFVYEVQCMPICWNGRVSEGDIFKKKRIFFSRTQKNNRPTLFVNMGKMLGFLLLAMSASGSSQSCLLWWTWTNYLLLFQIPRDVEYSLVYLAKKMTEGVEESDFSETVLCGELPWSLLSHVTSFLDEVLVCLLFTSKHSPLVEPSLATSKTGCVEALAFWPWCRVIQLACFLTPSGHEQAWLVSPSLPFTLPWPLSKCWKHFPAYLSWLGSTSWLEV